MKRAWMAEVIATALLVGIGLGSVHVAMTTGALTLPIVATCWGAAVVLLILLCGPASGAHANPAVTIALAALGRFPWRSVAPYAVAQLIGSLLAAALLHLIFADALAHTALASNRSFTEMISQVNTEVWPHPGLLGGVTITWWHAALAEAAGTGLILIAIIVCLRRRVSASISPLIIGGTVTLAIILFAPVSQAGFNPARDFGPRLIAWAVGADPLLSPSWFVVYMLAPVLGAGAAAWMTTRLIPMESP